jgi:hypothetical protein
MAGVELARVYFDFGNLGSFFVRLDCEKTDAFRNLNSYVSRR